MISKTGYLFFTLCLVSVSLNAQTAFDDDFADSNFTVSPTWLGDTAKFEINSAYRLQLNAASKLDPAYLSTASKAIINAEWQFYVKLDFNPSGSNYAKVYLASDQQDLTQTLNGYFVQIGGQSGSVDDVSLYRQDGVSDTKIIDGIDGTVGILPELRIKVTRDSSLNWELSIDTTSNFSNFVIQGNVLDTMYILSNFFGVNCIYTSTRSDKFFFDDFMVSGAIFKDKTPPKINGLQLIDSVTLQLTFSEKLEDSTVSNLSNYNVNKGLSNPTAVAYVNADSSHIEIHFSNAFQNGESYGLMVKNVADRNGNMLKPDTLIFSYFVPVAAAFRDIQINEFYPDISPTNGLPEAEFIELYNASNKIFDLEDWSISDGTTTGVLSSQLFKPGEYLLLCSLTDTAEFANYGKTQGLNTFPNLNNNEDLIQLSDLSHQVIDKLDYNLNWYHDKNKQDGGWSIEQINPKSNCYGINNFTVSVAVNGGTPAQVNSVFDTMPDQNPPELINAIVINADSIQLLFNETLDSSSIKTATYLFSSGNKMDTAYHTNSAIDLILLVLKTPLDSGEQIELSINNISDCAGNLIANKNTVQLFLPEMAAPFDIVINEILFNPYTGGSDFVELYNRSEKILNLQNIKISNGDGVVEQKTISDSIYLFYPGQYIGLSENIQNIKDHYPTTKIDTFIEVKDLPSYNDNEGTAMIFNSKGQVIDQINYSEDQHFELLANNEGVSLERINPDGSSVSNNFHSAAESVGFATPGFENSQFFKSTQNHGTISIEPETFSPDNDGYQDVLHINYQFDSPGYVANVSIFDRNGRLIKSLVQNELLGNNGSFNWDGISNDNKKARIGIYIILFEAFNTTGNKEVFKGTVVVAGFLD